MCDLTPHITLSPTQQKRYRLVRAFILTAFVIGVVLFAKELLLPTLSFRFNAAVDSLANTVSDPMLADNETTFSVVAANKVDRARIVLTVAKGITLPHNTTVSLRKGYGAFFAAINDTGLSPTPDANLPFPDGALIASSSGVFVTSGNTKRAFDTEETLLASGYNFAHAQKATSDERAAYKTGKIFALDDLHPAGTTFYTTDTNRFYYFDGSTLTPLPHGDTSTAIHAQEAVRSTALTCTLHKTLLPRRYACDFDLYTLKDFSGKRYRFTIPGIVPDDIAFITIKLATAPTRANIGARMNTVKSLILKNYE